MEVRAKFLSKIILQKIRILACMMLLVFSGCSEVHFDAPMPAKKRALTHFDSSVTGRYQNRDSTLQLKQAIYYNSLFFNEELSERDSCSFFKAFVSISDKKVWYDFRLKTLYRNQRFDTLRLLDKHKKEIKRNIKDYVIFEGHYTDTIFSICKGDRLKLSGGRYYLNHFVTKFDWKIFQICYSKDGQLSVNVTNDEDEQKLSNFLMTRRNILANQVHLSDEQFEKFITSGGFRNRYSFIKTSREP